MTNELNPARRMEASYSLLGELLADDAEARDAEIVAAATAREDALQLIEAEREAEAEADPMANYELRICSDCTIIAANDDWSGLSNLSPENEAARTAEIRAGFERLAGYVVVGDECGFSWSSCDCCQTRLGGDRHYATVLAS